MGRTYTSGTRQLTVEIDAELRERLKQRVGDEQRTLRAVVERALAHYMDNVPLNGAIPSPAPDQPKRGRPAGSKKGK
jgi:hypothetical protein